MLDEITKTIPSAKQENSRRIKQRARLAPFGRFLLRWSWYIVLSMTLLFITSSFVPDIPSPDMYQATLPVQVQLPRGLDGAINIKATATFFSGLFVSPATLSSTLPALHNTATFRTLGLSSLQSAVTAVPVANTNEILLTALEAKPQDASVVVTSVYQALLQRIHAQRSLVVNGLNTAVTNELNSASIDLANATVELQNLVATHNTSFFQYRQISNNYNVRLKRVNTLYVVQQTLLQQDFTHSDVLALSNTAPQITTVPGVGPTKAQRLALSPLIGLIMGLGGALLASRFSTTLSTQGKKRALVLPSATIIVPTLKDVSKKRLQVLKQTSSWALPLLRRLRYQAKEHEKRLQLIAVLSPKGREGKSTVAASLAMNAAQDGQRTIVIDANPQRPVLHAWFQLPNTTGTLDAIRSLARGTTYVPAPLVGASIAKLGIVPIGTINQGSSIVLQEEELRIDGLRTFTELLCKQADIIIFDGPSLLSDPGATNLALLADVTLLVVDAQKSQLPEIVEAETLLSEIGISPTVVLNGAGPEFAE